MKCRKCRRELQDNSIFCNWCGEKQIREMKKPRIPKPRLLASGKWFAQIMINGIRYPVIGKTKADYEAHVLALKSGLIEAQIFDNRVVRDVVNDYISARDGVISPATIDGYERKAKNNLQSIMSITVNELTEEKLQAAINLDKKRYSGKTIKEALSLVSAATGVRYDGLVIPSSKPQKKPPVYSTDDLRRLLVALNEVGGQAECAALLAVWLSLRRSEIIGLRWDDLLENSVRVRTARVYDKNHKLVEKDTKNKTSERIIPCDKYILEKLKSLPHKSDYVFSMSTSGLWLGIARACQLAGIEHSYLHGLRHTNASIMEFLGIPAKYSNKRGGWASDYIRQNVYTDTLAEGDILAAQKVDDFYLGLIYYGPPKPPNM